MNIFWVSVLLSWLPNALGIRVTQTPRTVKKMPGESLTINCVITQASHELYTTHWHRRNPGETNLQSMLIDGRYVESVNRRANEFSLQINELRLEDSAMYYCRAYCTDWIIKDENYGAGTNLTVIDLRPTPPTISLLYSATDELRAKGTVQLICLISEYRPGIIGLSWEKNGNAIRSGFTTSSPAKNSQGIFSSTSILEVPLQEWASGSVYSCQVSHSATESNPRKEIHSTSELTVFLRDPSVEEIWIKRTATLVCEVVSTVATDAAISWTVGGKMRTEGVLSEPVTKSGNQYLTIGRLSSSVEEWESGVQYSCSAQQGQSSTVVSKPTGKAKVEPVRPKLRLLPPSPEEIQTRSAVTLTCLISGFYPDNIMVSWQKDGDAFSSNISRFPTALEQDLTFSTRSLLVLPSAEWNKGSTYTCDASHPPSKSNVRVDISSPKDHCKKADISAKILNPLFEEIWTQQTATISCEVVYSDLENVTVSWKVGDSRRTEGVETQTPERRGSKFTIVSTLKVAAAEWDRGVEYLCFVQDNELQTPLNISTRKAKVGEMHRPKIYVLPPSPDEIDTEKTATLVCLASGFYPAEIYIAWIVNDTLLDSASPSQLDTDNKTGSSSIGSRLRLTSAQWNSGDTYTCLVGHPSLKMNLIRSIDKSHGKPNLVNISLVLTDSFTSCT